MTDDGLFRQILAEMARISPDDTPIGIPFTEPAEEARLLEELRSVPSGSGTEAIGEVVGRIWWIYHP
jgi:hypothetical protein